MKTMESIYYLIDLLEISTIDINILIISIILLIIVKYLFYGNIIVKIEETEDENGKKTYKIFRCK